jgi:hypothetical protein
MKLLKIAFVVILLGASSMVLAKIADPPPVILGNILFRSHLDYVEAVESSTSKILWKTVLFQSGYIGKYDPSLEEDVQQNIINELKLNGDVLIVRNNKGEEFRIDSKTGKVLSK